MAERTFDTEADPGGGPGEGSEEPLVQLTRHVLDRGPRPAMRGWTHLVAACVSVISGSVLSTYAWMTLPRAQALGVMAYTVGAFVLFAVSALYHRGPWGSMRTVRWWRRADHATIAVFIAATYTPLCLIVLEPVTATGILTAAWAGALLSVGLNLVWVTHPRWLAVVVYLVLGWLIVPLIPQLWATAGPGVMWLLLAGGIIYSFGALIYGFRWPGRHARIFGYHEYFHAATIIAATFHLAAVWIVVVQNQSVHA